MADYGSDRDSGDEGPTIADDNVVNKYKLAGNIVNDVLKKIIEKCSEGAKVLDLCSFGDDLLTTEIAKVFKKEKELKKGIAFPVCISINNCICHYSPLKSEEEVTLKNGDVVKIDMGAHIDGFIAVVAHTVVVGASEDNKVNGRKADAVMAAHQAAELALRLVKPGNTNNLVTEKLQKVVEEYNCNMIEGMLSHQLKQNVIDGEKAIIQNPNEAQRKDHEKCEFEVHEVYAIDVLVSTGAGKGRDSDQRTTVYKKRDTVYSLKMKASRQFFSDVEKKHGLMPFSLRWHDDEKKAKLGVVECVKHDLVEAFPVLYEREGEVVAQYKYTVLLLPNGPLKVTGLPFQDKQVESEHSVKDEELKTILAQSTNRKAGKKKKKKAAAAAVAEATATPEA